MEHQEGNYHEYTRSLLDAQKTFGQYFFEQKYRFHTRTKIHATAAINY